MINSKKNFGLNSTIHFKPNCMKDKPITDCFCYETMASQNLQFLLVANGLTRFRNPTGKSKPSLPSLLPLHNWQAKKFKEKIWGLKMLKSNRLQSQRHWRSSLNFVWVRTKTDQRKVWDSKTRKNDEVIKCVSLVIPSILAKLRSETQVR